jgi:putative peptidoglycan lipid II flippase
MVFIGKLLAFVREPVIAAYFGVGGEADSFFMAFGIPFIIFNLIGLPLATALLPVFIGYLAQNETCKAWNFAWSVGLMSITLLSGLFVLIFFLAPQIIYIYAPGLDYGARQAVTKLMRIMLPNIIFLSLIALGMHIMYSYKRFTVAGLLPIIGNVIIVISIILLIGHIGIIGAAIGVLMGTAVQLTFVLFYIFSIHNRIKISKLQLSFQDLSRYGRLILTVFASTIFFQASYIMIINFSSFLPVGSLSSLIYGSKIQMVIYEVIILSISAIVFPFVSFSAAKSEMKNLFRTLDFSIKMIIMIITPIIVGLVVLSEPLIQLIYERGGFDHSATLATSRVLIFYAVGLLGLSVNELLNRAFYSLERTTDLYKAYGGAIIINLILNILLVKAMGFYGLSLSFSLTVSILMIYMICLAKAFYIHWDIKVLCIIVAKVILASLVTGIFIHVLAIAFDLYPFQGSRILVLAKLGITIAAGSCIYVLLLILFRIYEVSEIIGKILPNAKEVFRKGRV